MRADHRFRFPAEPEPKWGAVLRRRPFRMPAPQVLRSKELQLLPLSGASAPGHRMRAGHRFRFLLAMNCQVAAIAADGAKAPYSGASGTMRQRAEFPQPTFWECTHTVNLVDCFAAAGLRQPW